MSKTLAMVCSGFIRWPHSPKWDCAVEEAAVVPRGQPLPILHFSLEWNDLVRAGTFLALAHFKLNGLAVVQSGVAAAHLDFRMVNKQVLATVFRCDKTKTFVRIEPLNCTFTHFILSKIMVNQYHFSTFEFTVPKRTLYCTPAAEARGRGAVYFRHRSYWYWQFADIGTWVRLP
jgi:hypothetical protein